ncbi:MAG TPA: glycosyltransferase [Candidatus Paceibacterota bacterium]|nr:glycosyltransferase [Candidatus Paceibacterota bacterium]
MSAKRSVTIGLGTRNGSRYIREALDSLLAQTHKNFELVISDNASTDNTREICEEYAKKDARVRYVRQESNIGPAGNFNFLKGNAKSEFFMWASDDDKWAPAFIEKCLAALDADPGAIVAVANYVHFDDLGRTKKEYPKLFFPFRKDLYGRLKEFILFTIYGGKSVLICGLWRREKISDFHLHNGRHFDDTDFVFRCLSRGYFVLVDEVLFYKRTKVFALDAEVSFPIRVKRIASNIKMRGMLLCSPLYLPGMIYLASLKSLNVKERIKLMLWNLFAALRLFVMARP